MTKERMSDPFEIASASQSDSAPTTPKDAPMYELVATNVVSQPSKTNDATPGGVAGGGGSSRPRENTWKWSAAAS